MSKEGSGAADLEMVMGGIQLSSRKPWLALLLCGVPSMSLYMRGTVPQGMRCCRLDVCDDAALGRLAAILCRQLVRELQPYGIHLMHVCDSVGESV